MPLKPLKDIAKGNAGDKSLNLSWAINEKIKSLQKEKEKFNPFSFLPGVTSKRVIQDKIKVLTDFKKARGSGVEMDFSKYSRKAFTGYTLGLLKLVPECIPGLCDDIEDKIKKGSEKRAEEKSIFNKIFR